MSVTKLEHKVDTTWMGVGFYLGGGGGGRRSQETVVREGSNLKGVGSLCN